MLTQFESYVLKNTLFDKTNRLLLAISGGIDSVVLAHLLKEGGYTFSLAHCNFQLRATDSEKDEAFCNALAKQLDVPFFVKRFDVEDHCRTHKQSIQMAARNLRYAWFNELMHEHNFEHLLTAHHASDSVETVFINLLRGTGIKGLAGIPLKNGYIARPLLGFTKEEVSDYAQQYSLEFRTDQSNLENKYERNFLRLNVIPLLKELNPTLERTFTENSFRFAQEAGMVSDLLGQKNQELCLEKNGQTVINSLQLKKEKYAESILHFILSPYGFSNTQQQNILENIRSTADVGKLFNAPGYQLAIAKNELVIRSFSPGETGFEPVAISSLSALKKHALFKTTALKEFKIPEKNALILNPAQLVFPLTIRGWEKGDKFKPFGMSRFKLLSDFFREEQLNAFDKQSCRLLVNGNGEIIWVMGYRSDERYKVTNTDAHFLKLTLLG